MNISVPEWLGPQKPSRTRGFLVTKYILFAILIIGVIETIAYSPIYYGILEKEARGKLPPTQDPDVWTLVLSTMGSVMFGVICFALGMTACLKEHFRLTIVYAIVLALGMVWTFVFFFGNVIIVFSTIVTCLVIGLALFYAHMIRRSDARL